MWTYFLGSVACFSLSTARTPIHGIVGLVWFFRPRYTRGYIIRLHYCRSLAHLTVSRIEFSRLLERFIHPGPRRFGFLMVGNLSVVQRSFTLGCSLWRECKGVGASVVRKWALKSTKTAETHRLSNKAVDWEKLGTCLGNPSLSSHMPNVPRAV